MQLDYKEIDDAEIEELLEFRAYYLNRYVPRLQNPNENEEIVAWLKNDILLHRKAYQSIWWDGKKVGYVCVFRQDGQLHLDFLIIFEQYRDRGIGTAIVDTYIRNALKEERKLYLCAYLRDTASTRFFERLGFRQVDKGADICRLEFEKSC